MPDLVSIASSAVSAYQRALGTVSNNIANVGSTGYSRQEVRLLENSPQDYGVNYFGTGVSLIGVRRLYDEFVESSLRNATSELGTQAPIVDYANRVVNIMGSEDVGLLSAFDQFFDAARQLSTDPSSLILRSQFLAKAEGLASRFGQLHGQLSLVEQESQGQINSQVTKLNQLSEQLALVNQQLRKTRYLDRQPPALLDQRDQLLREMSEIAKIQVKEALNGEITVSLGPTITRGQIVNIDGARKLSAIFNESAIEKVDLMIEPFSKTAEAVSGLSGGSLSGALSFRRQILAPTMESLDQLAKTMVIEVNAIHREGIDLQGRNGSDLFGFQPQFSVSALNGETNVVIQPELLNFQEFNANALSIGYKANAGQVNNLSLTGQFRTGDQITVTLNGNARSFTLLGAQVDVSGRPILGEPMSTDEVRRQVLGFLEGGNANSVDGAFGRQIRVQPGKAQDLLITSDVFGAFSLDISSTSASGRIDNQVKQGLWTVTDTVTGQTVSGVESVQINGMQLRFGGRATDGEMLLLKASNRPAAGIRLTIEDPQRVAAASRFRVIENQFNPSGVDATLRESFQTFPKDEALWLPNVISASGLEILDNNVVASEAIRLDRVGVTPIALIPEGYKDVALFLGELNGQNLDLQVFTRDGRHLIGRQMADELIATEEQNLGRPLRDDERNALIQQAGLSFMATAQRAGVSFSPGASYSADYLNVSGTDAYRDMELFYGVKGMVQEIQQLNTDHVIGGIDRLAASVTSGLVQPFTVRIPQDKDRFDIFGPDDLVLNGVPLGALVLEKTSEGVSLVMQATDASGRALRKVLVPTMTNLPGEPAVFEINAAHMQAWLKSQPGWGQGERQVLQFGDGAQGGSIAVTLAPGQTVTVSGITPYLTPAELADKVARAIEDHAYISKVSGRSVYAYPDGSVVVQFAATDKDMPRLSVTTGATNISVRVAWEPAADGQLGVGETQTYQFSPAAETGFFNIGGTTVEVAKGDSSRVVAQKVAAALGNAQRLLTFSGMPNTDGPLVVDGVTIALKRDELTATGMGPDAIAAAVKHALENHAPPSPAVSWRAQNPDITLTLIPGQGLRFTYGANVIDPPVIAVTTIPNGVTFTQNSPERFVDKHEGRRVVLNDDGSVTVRYLATEGDVANLGVTPVITPWPEVQTLRFSRFPEEAPLSLTLPTTFSIGQKEVTITAFDLRDYDQSSPPATIVPLTDDADKLARIAEKVQRTLESEEQIIRFTGDAKGGETLTLSWGDLSIPVTLAGDANTSYSAAQVADAVKNVLFPAPDVNNIRSGDFATRFPFAEVFTDGQGNLRVLFNPEEGNVADPSVRSGSATAISTSVAVQKRFSDQYPGAAISLSGTGDSLIVRYPVGLGDVANLSIPNAAVDGLSFALSTQNYRETEPGVFLNATTQNFRGLTAELLNVFNPDGSPLLGGAGNPPTTPVPQLRLTQTPLGQGEVQTLYFSEATGTGEIEIAGLKIKVEKGDSGAVVAQKVQQALAKAYGFSELGGSLRQYTVNADGSLTVRAAVSAGNVRDLQMTSSGTTGVSFRTETVDYLPSGETFESEVRLGLGRTGTSLDLAKLGFRTGVYLSGQVKEDLLIFATGEERGLGYTLGATYTEGSRDPVESLRAEPFDVVFTSATQYRIIDRNSGSVVADRRYDPIEGIRYRGVVLTLNASPAPGDRFAIDGNQDGIGNNANTLRLIQLQNARIVGGPEGRTLTDAYGQAVSDVGNMAFQASIAQKALEVVKDQAVQARDKVSGVSLDEEAADLIRFQQAYQASAKVMQTASILFDAIINIR